MITAIDSSVLLDIVGAETDFRESSAFAVAQAGREGRIVVCDIVVAEIAGQFSKDGVEQFLESAAIEFDPIQFETAKSAGELWRAYRKSGGPCSKLIADFLVAAHARLQADRLLTRNQEFYRRHFRDLAILTPAAR